MFRLFFKPVSRFPAASEVRERNRDRCASKERRSPSPAKTREDIPETDLNFEHMVDDTRP